MYAYRLEWFLVTRYLRLLVVVILLLATLAWCQARDSPDPKPASNVYTTEPAWHNPSWNASLVAGSAIKTPAKHVHRKTTRASRTRSARHGSASTATASSSEWDLLAQC